MFTQFQATAWDSGNYFPINTWSLISQQLRSRQSYCHHTAASVLLLTKCFRCKGHPARGCLSFNISHSIKPISRLDFPALPHHWLLIYPTAKPTVMTHQLTSHLSFFFFFLCQQYMVSELLTCMNNSSGYAADKMYFDHPDLLFIFLV